jgi:predicted O-methyltransferase YrrM
MTNSRSEPVILDSLEDMVFRAMSVLAGMQLDVFTPLKDGPLSADQIAASIGVGAARLRPLLYALVVTGLLTADDGLFANTAEADYYLVRGRPSYRGQWHKFCSDIWSAALQIGESIRTGKPQAEHDYANMREDELEEFMDGMYSLECGTWFARNYDFSSCRRVVDVGGGSGGLAIGLAEALPHLQVTVAELPLVAKFTRRFVERAGAAERVQVQAVDVVRQPITGSFDAAILRYILHVMSLEDACQVLLNVHQALKPGGTIYIQAEPLDDSRLTPHGVVLWGPIFTAIYEHGQHRTLQEYRDVVTKAGFEHFELHPDAVMTARKPVGAHSTDIHRQ